MDIIEVEPDDNKTMMTTSRMGADMRSTKTALYCNYSPPSTRQIQEVLSRKAAEQIGKESTRRQEGRSAEGA